MKPSNKILLSVFVLVAVSIISLLVKVRLDIGKVKAAVKTEPHYREIPVQPFESITLGNDIEVLLLSGSDYAMKITGRTEEDTDLVINTRVNEGNLELDLPENYSDQGRRHRIEITTPMVKKITLNNNAEVKIENMNQDSLEIDLSDVANLVADKITLDYLVIKAAGKTGVRSHRSTIDGIRVELDDSSECKLLDLDGGSVTGQVRGSAELRLSGWTEKLNVDMGKKARIIKRD